MKTAKLDFTNCTEETDFFDRIIEALGLGVDYCGRNWSAIYDFSRSEKMVEKVVITGTSDLKGYMRKYIPEMVETFDYIIESYEQRGKLFIYEIID